MRKLGPFARAALVVAGALLGIVASGTVSAWVTRMHFNEARPLPPAKGEPAPEPRAEAEPQPRMPAG